MRCGVGSFFTRRRRRRRRSRRRDAADNAAKDAADCAASHTAADAADHTGHSGRRRRKLVFFNDCDFLGDTFGSHQFAGVELPGDDFDHFNGRGSRRWGRRRRRRRRRHQETLQCGSGEHFSVDERQDHGYGDQDNLSDEGDHHCPALVGLAGALYERLFKHTSFLSLYTAAVGRELQAGKPTHRTALVGFLRTVSTRGVAGPPPLGGLGAAGRRPASACGGHPHNYARTTQSDWRQKPKNTFLR